MVLKSLHSRFFFALVLLLTSARLNLWSAEEARLLRQPTLSKEHLAFAHAGDLWIVDRKGGDARRLTSTPANESDPHFSPDGELIAFSSNRSGNAAVYVVPATGGTPTRLTWNPAPSFARGWSADGFQVLYASTRETAPVGYSRLWAVSVEGGPSQLLPAPWGFDGSYAPEGNKLIVDRMSRWDTEWRHYRGGQNTPLVILDLESLEEVRLPNERTTDIQPVWLGDKVYFLSDRDWSMNIYSYDPGSGRVAALTEFEDIDVKWLSGYGNTLAFERDGYLHSIDVRNKRVRKIEITLSGDFPWAEQRWEDLNDRLSSASLSPTGKRALFEARGEIFTVPVEKGSTRNLTRSSGAADRAPVWSPDGDRVAWFSDKGGAYALVLTSQDGLDEPRSIAIGESKMAWEPTWSPDGKKIAFVDDDVRIRVLDIETEAISTIDVGGINLERGYMGLNWSPDSKFIAYAKTFPNNYRRIVIWSVEEASAQPITDHMADAMAPAWSRDGKHLFFLASTNLGLNSGWANTSSIGESSTYGVYTVVLDAEDSTPFVLESDEEPVEEEEEESDSKEENDSDQDASEEEADGENAEAESDALESEESGVANNEDAEETEVEEEEKDSKEKKEEEVKVAIDFDDIGRRIVALPMPVSNYLYLFTGPEQSVFIAEGSINPQNRDHTLQKFTLKEREAKPFLTKIQQATISSDGNQILYKSGKNWNVVGSKGEKAGKAKTLKPSARLNLDRKKEWNQIFEEAWRYQRDYFYDPGMHGRDWDQVYDRYAPLLPFVRHRVDLNYVLDQMGGETSVGHSFVFGGDMPKVEDSTSGLLGVDLTAEEGRWRIQRIYTYESWNPKMKAPLDQPGLKVQEGHFILAVDGEELMASDDPYRLLDGTAGRQVTLHINETFAMEDAWTIVVEPINLNQERGLRQRAWVEDNRRRVDELSGGKLAYAWIPNTGNPGLVSFNRYFFAQQDKLGAVIDERYNGGGLLDDYMVDLMTRRLRAAITNEVPKGIPFRLPAGILGPKVLLINERAGSGGDFFPWVFRQQNAGPLIGMRTWGGLVKSSVHYGFVDGGAMTAPDNAVFDPLAKTWIGENEGIPPDIEVWMDAASVSQGRDPQLERAVDELLILLENEPPLELERPEFPRPVEQN